MKLFDRWYVQVLVVALGMLLATLGVGHCECWDMIVSDGKYSCETSDCDGAPYDDKSVCEDTAFAMNDAHRRRMEEAERAKFIDEQYRKEIPTKGCYAVDGCGEGKK